MADPTLLKLSEVRDRTGTSIETLRRLIAEDLLPGVERSANGQAYVRAEAVLDHAAVERLLTKGLATWVERAEACLSRVHAEIEAVSNDLHLVADDPRLPLGVDLLGFNALPSRLGADGSTLRGALVQLDEAALSVRIYHQALADHRAWVG